ncbi:MAG: pyridoxal-phosphate dependent enzyme [Bythopirellula sp.]
MSIWKYAERFVGAEPPFQLTLGEGDTPLVPSRSIGPKAGFKHLYYKLESLNPTGSYKDRFAAAAVADMLMQGKKRCVATSSGNTGSALAAWCAAAGLACHIAIVDTAPQGKLLQMLAYGARLYRIKGFGTDPEITQRTFETAQQIGNQQDSSLQISAFRYSPAGMNGVQTISFELIDQLGKSPEHVFCPAGGGGLTLAVARGFEVSISDTAGDKVHPRIHCVQPSGNNTIAGPLSNGSEAASPVQCTSQISGLQVPSVIDGDEVIAACRASGGTGHVVEDDEVYALQSRLASEEGIFCEPAGAVALAGALRARKSQKVAADDSVVCLVTGSGFKDLESVERVVATRECPRIDLDQFSDCMA